MIGGGPRPIASSDGDAGCAGIRSGWKLQDAEIGKIRCIDIPTGVYGYAEDIREIAFGHYFRRGAAEGLEGVSVFIPRDLSGGIGGTDIEYGAAQAGGGSAKGRAEGALGKAGDGQEQERAT